MELKKKQNKILELLKRLGELVESEIAYQTTSSQRYTKGYLQELEKNGLVEKRNIGKITYWKIKN